MSHFGIHLSVFQNRAPIYKHVFRIHRKDKIRQKRNGKYAANKWTRYLLLSRRHVSTNDTLKDGASGQLLPSNANSQALFAEGLQPHSPFDACVKNGVFYKISWYQ